MFSPLSLRLWCMAAMAPALTEAAAQPRSFKLPPTTPSTEHEGAQATSRDSPDSGHPNGSLTSAFNQQSLVGCRDLIQVHNQNGNTNNYLSSSTRANPRTLCANFDPQKLRKNLMGEAFNSSIQLLNGNSTIHHSNTMNNNSSKTQIGSQSPLKCNVPISPTLQTTTMSPQTPTIGTVTTSGSLASPSPTGTDTETENRSDDELSPSPVDRNVTMENEIPSELPTVSENKEEVNSNHNNNQSEQLDEVVISGKIEESSLKQQQLSRRALRLLRRLRRLQYKQVDSHSHQQMGGLVEHQNQQIIAANELLETNGNNADTVEPATANVPKYDGATTETPTLLGLVQQLEKENTALQNSSLSRKMPNRTNGNQSTNPSKRFRRDVRDTSNLLKAGVRHLQSCIDSDATESSSGESCDEEEGSCSEKGHTHVPVHRRALWKWAVDRAAVASRWTWLQAQVSDLEYRIRQQTDIYRQIRATKGIISLGEQSPPDDLMKLRTSRLARKLSPIEAKIAKLESRNDLSPSNLSTLISNVDRQTAKLNQSLQNLYSPLQKGMARSPIQSMANSPIRGKLPGTKPVNGYVESPQLSNDSSSDCELGDPANKRIRIDSSKGIASPPDISCTAARTRPIRTYRKRKLLRTSNIHQMSRKAQKLSSVRCGCCTPITPCVMCGGRYNNTQTVDQDLMPLSERVSLLDYSFHPVLSFEQDMPLSVHFERLLKSGDWQNRQASKSPLKKKSSHLSQSQQARRASQKLAKSAAAALLTSAKMRSNRADGKSLARSHSHPSSAPNTPKNSGVESNRLCRTDVKKRRAAQLAMIALKKNRNRCLSLPTLHSSKPTSSPTTPNSVSTTNKEGSQSMLSASMPANSLQAYMKKRRGESAFDINNIVIPYSMAASTRVEKLNYKEIVTPKWRILEQYDQRAENADKEDKVINNMKVEENEQEFEDLSDELIAERHAICEVNERRRYLGFVQNNKRGRSRTNSGSGTPEPWSPDSQQNENSLPSRTSATPSPLNTPNESKLKNSESIRRRASSEKVSAQAKSGKQHETHAKMDKDKVLSPLEKSHSSKSLDSVGDDADDWFIVLPWDARIFPLSEQEVAAMEGNSPPPSPKQSAAVKSETKMATRASTPELTNSTKPSEGSSRVTTPDFENESASDDDIEDPNDPEWTVITPDRGNGHKPTIVLKLAKR
ncbi:KAT8 regulatory NSL complex subunit 1-like isoform X3 [Ptychodera flava]|uniref:KAT8 regulatory NSL complex subunit 1-like isoform X3 n=2 Tax=Ptychodera flava TaxID=63121 RepID=UPI003969D2BF